MSPAATLEVDVVIFGGGAAGLWILDALVRRGDRVLLLESDALGAGQTVASQGIIHGGLKYSLAGMLTPSARAIRAMPRRWRRCLAGEEAPDLRRTRLRAEFCHLWCTDRLRSRLGFLGAQVALQAKPTALDTDARPACLEGCADVARLDEQVIEPASFVGDLADRHRGCVLRVDGRSGVELDVAGPGEVRCVRLIDPVHGAGVEVRPRRVVLAAGAGNAALWSAVGGSAAAMQRRPLHMVVVRGDIPVLNGHCVDGNATRATITSTRDAEDRVVWQVGGQLAETGVDLEPDALVARARDELAVVVPGADLDGAQWTTYRVDRAEPRTGGGRRPERAHLEGLGRTLLAWPTKLALVPELADAVLAALPAGGGPPIDAEPFVNWPRPGVALPPWEQQDRWISDRSAAPACT